MPSVRNVVQNCLGKSGNLSLLRDVFGVYGVNPNVAQRSLSSQLNLIQNLPFVRVALVTIQGAVNTNLQRDLDIASTVYQSECNAWVYCTGSIIVNNLELLILNQDDCSSNNHSVSSAEDDLFDLGRNLGANIVCYYLLGFNSGMGNNINVAGCAAHPEDRRGFWVNQSARGYSSWTFAHELTHVVGDNQHICDTDNLMLGQLPDNSCSVSGTRNITNPPADLDNEQCNRILDDPDIESCN